MIIPSIDLMNNTAVQLKQGKEKVLEQPNLKKLIKEFRLFPETNVIDLDAALSNGSIKKSNKELIKSLCKKLRCNVGGGIRSKELVYEYLRAGAKHIIVGTSANKEFLKSLPPSRVIVALDLKGGKLATHGWTKTKSINIKNQIKKLKNYCAGFLITNVDVEGLNKGANKNFIKKLAELKKEFNKRIIIAGGISEYKEIKEIEHQDLDCVLGMSIYTGKINLNKALVNSIDFEKSKSKLIPTIVQDENNQVLMLAYSSKFSLHKSLTTQYATYFSRSRNKLWTKGESSGNKQKLTKITYDCDNDTLLFRVKQKGFACHKNTYSCFNKENKEFNLNYLKEFLKKRIDLKNKSNSISYTAKIANNSEKLHKKIIEEAFEVTQAKSRAEKVWEVADLTYFISIYMAKHNLTTKDILNELSLRHTELT
ncbi:bifunctional phosphoribosyl-AMP cyclohydrolase/phosphoribosyl-ATP diphosphatase HisIE [Candidatus Woesearchaeota archaeon]|jgi:phosphoribosyl-AMP cyclohydrolase / phosphoribosyl-ATP pyrophosphohydrolase|nr:bifunctional phosphoribosyl-AMP cyclohydrolase/phosphoribosyl-ATP diphosphatase HisIE [Candidatus Woesearchaeota archaeon]MBT6518908.1 bifunctional phosphoribosyl-AMP cyclohydrolase/phosphoribosyl-ATP diphosphatase HisIE [Candidatus Woesearchaeota archaeon]MBT7367576.1 bifunctional phosphoribosyl-AMP cyclohydrolase/phosphoribosyl-ATP diphosphatase HisIE [Candidatus Woesearchaeota archaeon]